MYQSGRAGDEAKKRRSHAKSGRVGITVTGISQYPLELLVLQKLWLDTMAMKVSMQKSQKLLLIAVNFIRSENENCRFLPHIFIPMQWGHSDYIQKATLHKSFGASVGFVSKLDPKHNRKKIPCVSAWLVYVQPHCDLTPSTVIESALDRTSHFKMAASKLVHDEENKWCLLLQL